MESPLLHIFQALVISCTDDGDGMFISKEYQAHANAFKRWLDVNDIDDWHRYDYDTYIVYRQQKMCLWFTNKRSNCPWPINISIKYNIPI